MGIEQNRKKSPEKHTVKVGEPVYAFRKPFAFDVALRIVAAQSLYTNRVIIVERQKGKNSGRIRKMYFSSHFSKDPYQRLIVCKALIAPNVVKISIK